MIRALYVPLALGALLAFAAPARGQTTVIGGGSDDCPISINGKCYSCPDNNYGNLGGDCCECADGSACTVVESDVKDVADQAKDAAKTAADATKNAATTAAEATKNAATTAAEATKNAATTAAEAAKAAGTTAAEATKNAADKAAAEATAIASGVTAAVSSASFATGASAVFGAAMVLMA